MSAKGQVLTSVQDWAAKRNVTGFGWSGLGPSLTASVGRTRRRPWVYEASGGYRRCQDGIAGREVVYESGKAFRS